MDRRSFLTLSGAAASASALGLASARGLHAAESDLDAALERARAHGKPLLVALVPDYAPAALQRGQFWGQVFSVGSDELLADLCLCELVFHPVGSLRATLGEGTPDIDDRHAAALLETDGSGGVHVLALPPADAAPERTPGLTAHDVQARARAADFGELLRAVVAPDGETLARRAEQSQASWPDAACYEAASFLGVRPKLNALDRVAATVRVRIELDEQRREAWIRHLAQAALLRLWEVDPLGAQWRTLALDPCPPCGMAIVPEASRHFLEFYTR
jgi:hypothetical protein